MKNSFDLFWRCLEEAGRRMQDKHYFKIRVADSEKLIFRERVYCYELYHQLRLVIGDIFLPCKLDGEVDKASHPNIENACGKKKPDFIVHKPGDMKNLVVIEVKPVTVGDSQELKDDLKKLKCFLTKAKYHWGIMLIYGDGHLDLPKEIVNEVETCHEERILLVWHQGPGEKPVIKD